MCGVRSNKMSEGDTHRHARTPRRRNIGIIGGDAATRTALAAALIEHGLCLRSAADSDEEIPSTVPTVMSEKPDGHHDPTEWID